MTYPSFSEISESLQTHSIPSMFAEVFYELHNGPASPFSSVAVALDLAQTMQEWNLNPSRLLLASKTEWLETLKAFSQIVGYAIEAPRLGHWKLFLKAEGSEGTVFIQVELLAEKVSCGDDYHAVQMANGEPPSSDHEYVIPRLLSNVEPPKLPLSSCQVPWVKFWTCVALDEKVFTIYNGYTNNCQQYVERICRALNLPVDVHRLPTEWIRRTAVKCKPAICSKNETEITQLRKPCGTVICKPGGCSKSKSEKTELHRSCGSECCIS